MRAITVCISCGETSLPVNRMTAPSSSTPDWTVTPDGVMNLSLPTQSTLDGFNLGRPPRAGSWSVLALFDNTASMVAIRFLRQWRALPLTPLGDLLRHRFAKLTRA